MKFSDLYALYWTRHAETRLRCPSNVRYWASAHLSKWADREIQSIKSAEIQDWADELGVASPSAARRAVHQMAAIINWGARRGHHAGPNPCASVDLFNLRSRERFLLPAEIGRLRAALDKQPSIISDFFWLCLLTGARRGNVLAMAWADIDTDLALWRIPTAKNGDSHLIPLCPAALAILERRRLACSSPWVFPGRRPGQHLKEVKRAWRRTIAEAGLSDLRIHDLRRTVGSYMAIAGESQYVIGKALGHKDQRSTAVYARLDLSPVRSALLQVSERLTG